MFDVWATSRAAGSQAFTESWSSSDRDHAPHHGGSVRSSTFSSYVAGGKRGSSASAVSATSDKGELVDTFSKLNPKVLVTAEIFFSRNLTGGFSCNANCLHLDAPQTLLDMITGELIKLGYEAWQPPLGDPGVVEHQRRPDLFSTPTPSTTCSTPASKHK
ncbi:unnamed protein product [Cylicocyclus nassatus]|uniref:Uncharacterized protein n=1 Tax=Cylicocyclus nassatus TaxID=53992 RepID=A0AA36GSQ0_CYLNA|nr:unnamed protein product [Cylicocyclus nassatus]